jgi:tetratricopeptide (TPR) repeat protein
VINRSNLLIVVLSACCLLPQSLLAQPEQLLESAPSALSDLQLDPARQLDLQNALQRRDYKRAETILVEESNRDPKSPRAARLLDVAAGIFFLDGRYLDSVISWKRAEAIAPLDDRSRFTLAMAYIRLDRRDWARTELKKLAASRPTSALYLYWLARLDYDAQNYTAAISQLRTVIGLDPKMARAYNSLGLCYDYVGQFEKAVESYNHAIDLNRLESHPSPWPNVNLAVTLIAQGHLPEAERNLREALRYDARLPQAHYQLGRLLEMQAEYKAAAEALRQAVASEPTYPEPHLLLGQIYHRLGEHHLAQVEADLYQSLKKTHAQPTNGLPQSHHTSDSAK